MKEVADYINKKIINEGVVVLTEDLIYLYFEEYTKQELMKENYSIITDILIKKHNFKKSLYSKIEFDCFQDWEIIDLKCNIEDVVLSDTIKIVLIKENLNKNKQFKLLEQKDIDSFF